MNRFLERVKTYDATHLAKYIIEWATQASKEEKIAILELVYKRTQKEAGMRNFWYYLTSPDVATAIGRSKKLRARATRKLMRLVAKEK